MHSNNTISTITVKIQVYSVCIRINNNNNDADVGDHNETIDNVETKVVMQIIMPNDH